jgi:rubrerythrin
MVPVKTTAEVLAIAEALEQAAVQRYAALGQCMRRVGHADVARIFEDLAEEEKRHVESVHRLADLWRPTEAAPDIGRWVLPETFEMEQAGSAALLTPYKALSIAVRGEERAFSFWTYVASEADQDEIRVKAETMARQELVHAAKLRHERRRAFHAERGLRKTDDPTVLDAGALRARLGLREAEAADLLSLAADHLDGKVDPAIPQVLRGLADRFRSAKVESQSRAAGAAMKANAKRAAVAGPAGTLFEAIGVLDGLVEHYLILLGHSIDPNAMSEEMSRRCDRAIAVIGQLNAALYALDPALKELARRAPSVATSGAAQ